MGRLWGTPGKWMKASIIRALALEIGYICMEATEIQKMEIQMMREEIQRSEMSRMRDI